MWIFGIFDISLARALSPVFSLSCFQSVWRLSWSTVAPSRGYIQWWQQHLHCFVYLLCITCTNKGKIQVLWCWHKSMYDLKKYRKKGSLVAFGFEPPHLLNAAAFLSEPVLHLAQPTFLSDEDRLILDILVTLPKPPLCRVLWGILEKLSLSLCNWGPAQPLPRNSVGRHPAALLLLSPSVISPSTECISPKLCKWTDFLWKLQDKKIENE